MKNNCSVLFDEKAQFPVCYFNWKWIDKYLLNKLISVIHIDSGFIFYNINEMKNKILKAFKSILSNYSLDLYAEYNKSKVVFLYPEDSFSKAAKFKSFDSILKLIQICSKSFIKELLNIYIINAVLDDTEVLYIWENLLCDKIIIKNSEIRWTKFDVTWQHFNQHWNFENCSFQEIAPHNSSKGFSLKIIERGKMLLSLSKFTDYQDTGFNSLLDQICISDGKKSLYRFKHNSNIYSYFVEKLKYFIIMFNTFEYKTSQNNVIKIKTKKIKGEELFIVTEEAIIESNWSLDELWKLAIGTIWINLYEAIIMHRWKINESYI